jgi:hypothetical protein
MTCNHKKITRRKKERNEGNKKKRDKKNSVCEQ